MGAVRDIQEEAPGATDSTAAGMRPTQKALNA